MAFSSLSEGIMGTLGMIGILVQIIFGLGRSHQQPIPQHHPVHPPPHHAPPPQTHHQAPPPQHHQPHYQPQGYYPQPQPGYYPPQQPHGYYPQPSYPQPGAPGFDPTTFAFLGGLGQSGVDPTTLLALGGGGLGGLAGPYTGDGIDPMILLAMNANGMGGGIDGLLSAGLGGDGAGLFGLMLGGEGMRDPSKGISNMLDRGIISQGDDLDNDGEPDHLVETRHKIDDYLAKQWLLGKRKL